MNIETLLKEIQYRTARSGGSGGQNVNKVETKVEAFWHIESSSAVIDAEKILIFSKLENNINKEGYLQVTNQTERSQLSNKILAEKKLIRLVEKALKKEKFRKPTKIPPSVSAERLQEKKQNADKKAQRKKVSIPDKDTDLF